MPSPLPTLSANWLPLPFAQISINNIERIKFQKAVGIGGLTKLSLDGKYLAMASRRLALYEFSTLLEIPLKSKSSDKVDPGFPIAIGFSPDGKLLVASYKNRLDDEFRVWRTSDGSLLFFSNSQRYGPFTSIEFSPDGAFLVLGGYEGIVLFDPETFEGIKSWTAHTWFIDDLAFSPDGTKLASVSSDNTFKIWNFPNGQKLFETVGEKSDDPLIVGIEDISFSSDGKLIATGSNYGFVEIWQITKNPFTVLRTRVWETGTKDTVYAVAFSADNTVLVTSSWTGTQFWSVSDGSYKKTKRIDSCSRSLEFSRDGTLLFCLNSIWGVK